MVPLVDQLQALAAQAAPHECCGLIVGKGHNWRLIPARNVSHEPRVAFQIAEEAYLEVKDYENVIGVFHSHVDEPVTPSDADRSGCEASGVPWHIIQHPTGDYTRIEPCGFEAPLLERVYVHGVHDCYAAARDWYGRSWGLWLPNFPRKYEWWLQGQNLYLDNFEACGFVEIPDDVPVQVGDAFLIQVNSPKPNHCAVYLGEEKIYHHVDGRLSTIDAWGGFWAKHRYSTLRHSSKMGSTSNG